MDRGCIPSAGGYRRSSVTEAISTVSYRLLDPWDRSPAGGGTRVLLGAIVELSAVIGRGAGVRRGSSVALSCSPNDTAVTPGGRSPDGGGPGAGAGRCVAELPDLGGSLRRLRNRSSPPAINIATPRT